MGISRRPKTANADRRLHSQLTDQFDVFPIDAYIRIADETFLC